MDCKIAELTADLSDEEIDLLFERMEQAIHDRKVVKEFVAYAEKDKERK